MPAQVFNIAADNPMRGLKVMTRWTGHSSSTGLARPVVPNLNRNRPHPRFGGSASASIRVNPLLRPPPVKAGLRSCHLLIEDATVLDYSSHEACEGLGRIGRGFSGGHAVA